MFQSFHRRECYFPQARSFFMDLTTFRRFFENDPGEETHVKTQLLLIPAEQEVYDLVKENNWRLEQEKIPHSYVLERLTAILHDKPYEQA